MNIALTDFFYLGERKLIARQSIALEGVHIDKHIFHIGVGECNDRFKMVFYKDSHVVVGWPYIMDFINEMTAYTDDRHAMIKRICMLSYDDMTLLTHSIYCIRCRGVFRFVISKLLRQDNYYDVDMKLDKRYSFCSRHDISFCLEGVTCEEVEEYVKS